MKGINQGTARKRGFTLIELMVVLTLIGIISAVIIPEMKGTYQDALLRSTSRELVNVLGLAYSSAVSQQQPHRVRFDTVNGRYFLEKRNRQSLRENDYVAVQNAAASEGKIDRRIALELRSADNEFTIPAEQPEPSSVREEMVVPEQADSISFYPDGTADAREIMLQDQDGFRLALRINPTTARIQIVELEHK